MKYWLIYFVIGAAACTSPRYTSDYVQTSILGTWSLDTDSNPSVFRFVRTDTFETLRRGFRFHNDGSLDMYGPWGCQMPPNYRQSRGSWAVDNKGRIVVNVQYFTRATAHWEIISLKPDELRFTTDLVL
jgi:hypothetical protein